MRRRAGAGAPADRPAGRASCRCRGSAERLSPSALTGAGGLSYSSSGEGLQTMDVRLLWLALGAFAGSVESSLIVSVLPAIATETGVSLSQAGYLIFGYSIAYAHRHAGAVDACSGHGPAVGGGGRRATVRLMALLLGVLPGFLLMVLARTCWRSGRCCSPRLAQSTAVALRRPSGAGRAVVDGDDGRLDGGRRRGAALGAGGGAISAGGSTICGLGVLAITASATCGCRLPRRHPGERRTLRERLGGAAVAACR